MTASSLSEESCVYKLLWKHLTTFEWHTNTMVRSLYFLSLRMLHPLIKTNQQSGTKHKGVYTQTSNHDQSSHSSLTSQIWERTQREQGEEECVPLVPAHSGASQFAPEQVRHDHLPTITATGLHTHTHTQPRSTLVLEAFTNPSAFTPTCESLTAWLQAPAPPTQMHSGARTEKTENEKVICGLLEPMKLKDGIT